MTTRLTALSAIAGDLERDLRSAYDPEQRGSIRGGQPLVSAFSRYGFDAADAGVSLEDALAAAVETLQALFERTGGTGSDPSTVKAAGISLAAVARAYQNLALDSDQQPDSGEPVPMQVTRLSALHQINRAATANLKLSDMLDTVVHVVADTTDSDACEVFLYDDATGLLTLRAAVGLNPASVNAVTIRIGSGITGRAALESQLISAPDAHDHEYFLAHPGIGDEIYTSQVSVPIINQVQNRLVGTLNIHSIERREPEDGELEFLETVAGELAISIENARQYSSTDERLRQKVAELGTLQRAGCWRRHLTCQMFFA
jgi:putative methionine-R-sulfoxide reductase with GAF domain